MTVTRNSPYSTAGIIVAAVDEFSVVSVLQTPSQFRVALTEMSMRGTGYGSATSASSNGSKKESLPSNRCSRCSALPCLRRVCSAPSQLSPSIVLPQQLALTLLEIISMWAVLPALVLQSFAMTRPPIICKTLMLLRNVCPLFQTKMTLQFSLATTQTGILFETSYGIMLPSESTIYHDLLLIIFFIQ